MYTTIIHPITGRHVVPLGDEEAMTTCLFLIHERPHIFISNTAKDAVKKALRVKKKKIPQSFRTAVFERDGYECRCCGIKKELCVDHVVPESKGGRLEMDNVQTLCRSCNSRKGGRYG